MTEKKNTIGLKKAMKILRLSKKIVVEMIDDGLFAAKKVGRGYQIDREEIDEWLANLSDAEMNDLAVKRTICRFSDYFTKGNIELGVDGTNKYEVVSEISLFAKKNKIVTDHRWLYQVLIAREELISTAVGNGVAFLHPRHMHPKKIKKPSILYCRSKVGLDFEAADHEPVQHFFVLLLKDDRQHLFSLSLLSRLIQNKDLIKKIKVAKEPKEIHKLILEITNL